MLDGILTFLFGITVGIVFTIALEIIFAFTLFDKLISLFKPKETK
jgi:hypothetical protein